MEISHRGRIQDMPDSAMAGTGAPLLGLWDLRTEPLTLGGALNLAVELAGYFDEQQRSPAGVCFIWDADHPLPGGLSASSQAVEQLTVDTGGSPVIDAMAAMQAIPRLYAAGSLAALREFLASGVEGVSTWPNLGQDESPLVHDHGATLNIQAYFRRNGCVPQIAFTDLPKTRAADLLNAHARGTIPIIIHIKNDPTAAPGETANLEVWAEFLRRRSGDAGTTFVVIGNEELGGIGDQANVVVTQKSGNDLPRDLALIQQGAAFMGIASGPGHMAILGERPYAVFKPLHVHPDFMALEFGGMTTFSFAAESQRFIRIDPSADDLEAALDSIYDAARDAYMSDTKDSTVTTGGELS